MSKGHNKYIAGIVFADKNLHVCSGTSANVRSVFLVGYVVLKNILKTMKIKRQIQIKHLICKQ